jgi:hypothetical protein
MDRLRGSAAAMNRSSEAMLQSCEIQRKKLAATVSKKVAATVLVVFIEYSTRIQPPLVGINTGSDKQLPAVAVDTLVLTISKQVRLVQGIPQPTGRVPFSSTPPPPW